VQSGGFAGQLDFFDPRKEMLEDHLELEPRDMGACAEMFSHAKSEMVVGKPIDAELVGVREQIFLAVRRGEKDRDMVALFEFGPLQFGVAGRGSCEMNDRTGPAQDLLEHRLHQVIRIALEEMELVRIVDQSHESAAGAIAGGFIAGDHDDLTPGENLNQLERLAVDFGIAEEADQIVLGILLSFFDESGEVGEHFDERAGGHHAGVLFPRVLRIVAAELLVGPIEDQFPIRFGNPQHPGDDGDGDRGRNPVDKINFRITTLFEQVIDDFAADPFDIGVEFPDIPWRELFGNQHSMLSVHGRIHFDQGRRSIEIEIGGLLHIPDDQSGSVLPDFRGFPDLSDRLMACDGVERNVPVEKRVNWGLGSKDVPFISLNSLIWQAPLPRPVGWLRIQKDINERSFGQARNGWIRAVFRPIGGEIDLTRQTAVATAGRLGNPHTTSPMPALPLLPLRIAIPVGWKAAGSGIPRRWRTSSSGSGRSSS